MKLGSRAAEAYVLLAGTAFLLLAPCFAPEGGYASMTAFKAGLYAVLTLFFLLVSLPDLPRPKAFSGNRPGSLPWECSWAACSRRSSPPGGGRPSWEAAAGRASCTLPSIS